MKTIAYTALHYGRDYLGSAIRSVIDYVDEYHILYTAQGSHGHRSAIPCPEGRDELQAIAQAAAGDKLHWHEGTWTAEGQQRDSIHRIVPDADVILVLDADEIWPELLVEYAIAAGQQGMARHILVPIIHYWRSFYRAVLHDPAYPVRIICPHVADSTMTLTYDQFMHESDEQQYINHMGYAQRPDIVAYKLTTHGHKNEFRQDVNWFQDVFMTNRQHDTHPVGSDFWNPEAVKPLDYMPGWMFGHPYYGQGVIGEVIAHEPR